jgi:hypothetical protein
MNEKTILAIVEHKLLVSEELMFEGLTLLSSEDQKIVEKILLEKIKALNLHRDVKQIHPKDTQFERICRTQPWLPDNPPKKRKYRLLCAETTVMLFNPGQYERLKVLPHSVPEYTGIGESYCSSKDQFNRRYGRLVATIRAMHYVKESTPPQPMECSECSKNNNCPVGHDFAGCTGDVE